MRAARTVFARKGYNNTVVEDIAAEAGIGKGTLYLYFPSKEQVYLAALLDNARDLETESRRSVAAAPGWRDALRAYLEVRLRYVDRHQDFLRIYLSEFRGIWMQDDPRSAELHALAEAGEQQLAAAFAAAMERGEMRSLDPRLAATTVADLSRGLLERRLGICGRRPQEVDAEFAIETLCRAMELSPNGC